MIYNGVDFNTYLYYCQSFLHNFYNPLYFILDLCYTDNIESYLYVLTTIGACDFARLLRLHTFYFGGRGNEAQKNRGTFACRRNGGGYACCVLQ